MQTIEYRTKDKSSWPRGPWDDELDKLQWEDAGTGLLCLIVRGPSGALCGYVGLPVEHKLFGQDYDLPEVSVHGGLTFASSCEQDASEAEGVCHKAEGPDSVWWFGFDCAHAGDLLPEMQRRFSWDHAAQYRDLAYVKSEVKSLAKQLKEQELMPKPPAKPKYLTLSPDRSVVRLRLKWCAKHGELMFASGQSYNSLTSGEPLALDVIQAGWLRAQLASYRQEQQQQFVELWKEGKSK